MKGKPRGFSSLKKSPVSRLLRLHSAQDKRQIEGCDNQGYGGEAQADEFVLFVETLVHIVEAAVACFKPFVNLFLQHGEV